MPMRIVFALLANRLTRFTIFSLETELNLNYINNISRAGVALLVLSGRRPRSEMNLRAGKEPNNLFLSFHGGFLVAVTNDC